MERNEPKERRDHRRRAAHVFMEIRGHVQGSRVTERRGVTLDISSGGALAVFPEQVAANLDKSFMVRFVDESDALIAPGFRWGTILRSNPVRSECVVAVQFRPPLPPALMGTLLGAHLAPAKLV